MFLVSEPLASLLTNFLDEFNKIWYGMTTRVRSFLSHAFKLNKIHLN